MVLLLDSVLNFTKEEIQNTKIEFNMQAGSGGQPFLDKWLKHSDAEKHLAFVQITPIGVSTKNSEISILDSECSVLHE